MSDYLHQKLVQRDAVGAGITLTHMNKKFHGTLLGGVCSLIAQALVLIFLFSEMYQLIAQPEFNQNI